MASESDRHPIRALIKFAIFFGIMFALTRFIAAKKEEFSGLTETEARAKMEAKLSGRLGEEKATDIADQVIPVLREWGMFKAEIG